MIKQISIFLENESGRLVEVAKILGENNIDIRALTVAETADFGILRLIVDQPDKAYEVLKDKGIAVVENEVLGVEISDEPGGLAYIAEVLAKEGVNIDYVYAFVTESKETATVVLRLNQQEKGKEILEREDVRLISSEEVANI